MGLIRYDSVSVYRGRVVYGATKIPAYPWNTLDVSSKITASASAKFSFAYGARWFSGIDEDGKPGVAVSVFRRVQFSG